ncbi:MAG: DDE-type integrase/transposase/recombinase [Ignisphaera sp.]
MNKRELRGLGLIEIKDSVKPTDDGKVFLVRSETDPNVWYRVSWDDSKWVCECSDFLKKKKKCKHIWCLIYWLLLRLLNVSLKDEANGNVCPKCGSSENVVKRGFRYNLSGPKQTYYCKDCGKRFTERNAFLRMKNDALIILTALDLYFKGLSLRKIRDHLRQIYSCNVHHTTILKWIKKYGRLVGEYMRKLDVEFGDRWGADETVIKIGGREMRLWALMDYETKLLIAHKISERRSSEEAEDLLRKGIERSGRMPLEVVTDGFSGYHKALEKITQENNNKETEASLIHIHGPLVGEINNNLVERFFGEVKQRVANMRGIKNKESFSDFLEGYLSIYNIHKLKPEMSLPMIFKRELPKNPRD